MTEPAPTIGAKRRGQSAEVLVVNEKHQPVSMNEPANTVRGGGAGHSAPAMVVAVTDRKKRPASTKGPQSTRTLAPDRPATTVQAREDRVGSGSPVLEWPWQRPSTTVTSRPGLPPPGHHDEDFAIMSLPDAVILSERAATILQGFAESWVFSGVTKKARWAQIGQAMPPALAHAVALAVVEQEKGPKP